MTNTAIKAILDEAKERVYMIALNNAKYLLIGYKGSPKIEDIELKTIGGVDMLLVHHKNDRSTNPPVSYTEYYNSDFVEAIGVMDTECADYRVDPMTFR